MSSLKIMIYCDYKAAPTNYRRLPIKKRKYIKKKKRELIVIFKYNNRRRRRRQWRIKDKFKRIIIIYIIILD